MSLGEVVAVALVGFLLGPVLVFMLADAISVLQGRRTWNE